MSSISLPLSPSDAALITVASQVLRARVNQAETFRADCANATPGSDRAQESSTDPGSWAFHIADLALVAGDDHLRTIADLFDAGRIPIYSAYTLLRGALECYAWAAWLQDPTLTADDRLAGALNRRLKTADENRKGLQRLRTDPDFVAVIGRLRITASAAGISETLDGQTPSHFGQSPPNITELIEQLVNGTTQTPGLGRALYAVLSGNAHGTFGALLLSFQAAGPANATSTMGVTALNLPTFVNYVRPVLDVQEVLLRRMGSVAGKNASAMQFSIPW
jgi:hypothetical protein